MCPTHHFGPPFFFFQFGLGWKSLFGPFHPRLSHEFADVLFEVVDPAAHVVDAGDDLIRHLLEPLLHLPQQRPHERRQILDILRVGGRGHWGRSRRWSRSRRRGPGRSFQFRHLHRCSLAIKFFFLKSMLFFRRDAKKRSLS